VEPGKYDLVIFEPTTQTHELATFEVTAHGEYGITISWPTDGATGCRATFQPYGTANAEEAPLQATMTRTANPADNKKFTGTFSQQPLATNPGWAVSFPGLEVGTYTLRVWGQVTLENQAKTVANIQIMNCP